MVFARVAFWICLVFVVGLAIYVGREWRRGGAQTNVRNALGILSGVVLAVLFFVVPYAFPDQQDLTDVRVIGWDGPTSARKPLLIMWSCRDEGMPSNFSGTTPTYAVILESKLELTLVNYGTIPDGIVAVEIVHSEDEEFIVPMLWRPMWYVITRDATDESMEVDLPMELHPRIPRKLHVRAFRQIETKPEVPASSLYRHAEPLKTVIWRLRTLEEEIDHRSEFMFYAPEALDDGRFKFERECREVIPEWPLPIVWSQVNE